MKNVKKIIIEVMHIFVRNVWLLTSARDRNNSNRRKVVTYETNQFDPFPTKVGVFTGNINIKLEINRLINYCSFNMHLQPVAQTDKNRAFNGERKIEFRKRSMN